MKEELSKFLFPSLPVSSHPCVFREIKQYQFIQNIKKIHHKYQYQSDINVFPSLTGNVQISKLD